MSFPRIPFRKGMTLKMFIWKSLEFWMDSLSSPDLHRLLVPQLTRAICGQNGRLLPLWYQRRCWQENGCSPVLYGARSSWTQHLRSHLYRQTHEHPQWPAEEKASLIVNVYQGWGMIWPEGPHWVIELDERTRWCRNLTPSTPPWPPPPPKKKWRTEVN